MRNVALVALGGGIGAAGRYLASGWIHTRTGVAFPWGTFAVNIAGSFLIGTVLGLVEEGLLSSTSRLFLAVGVLGGFTTFSSFSYENLQLLEQGSLPFVLANSIGQVVLGITAAYLGLVVGRAFGVGP